MILANLRAGLWKYLAIAGGALAVLLLIAALFLRGSLNTARAEADRFREEASAARAALEQANKNETANADATGAARSSGDNRRQEQAARAARVKDYADAAGDSCTGNADLLRELQEGSGRVRAAEGGLRR